MTHPQIPPDTVIEPRDVLAEALAEGLHKAMCYRPTTLHNRLACERPAVYLNLALAAIEHPAFLAALAARGYVLSPVPVLGADDLGAAWAEAEAALPEGWRPIHLAADDDDWTLWLAVTSTRAFFDGETDSDGERAEGTGPTPAAALRALAAALAPTPAPAESDCPKCGEWRDSPQADCANCGHHDQPSREPGTVSELRCIFTGCVATWRHSHGGFPGGYDNPDDPKGVPIPFQGDDPEPDAVRDYNGARLDEPSREPELDAAWKEAEAALPEGAWIALEGPMADGQSIAAYRRERGMATPAVNPPGMVYAPTPAAALRALASTLVVLAVVR